MTREKRKSKSRKRRPFFEHLQEVLEPTLPEDLLDKLPRGYQDLKGNLVLKLKESLLPYKEEIGEAISQIRPRTKSIWIQGQIRGKFRKPEEIEYLWGSTNSEIIHKENGVQYCFDFTKIMFAKGNIHERTTLPEKISTDDILVDMYTGIGYFSLGIAKHARPHKIYSIEMNPVSFHYLKKNIVLNEVEDIIQPIHGDCRVKVPELAEQGVVADRVLMGLLPEPREHISAALTVAKPGTWVLYEGVDKKDGKSLFQNFETEAAKQKWTCNLQEVRVIKNFAPHRYHVVIEVIVNPKA